MSLKRSGTSWDDCPYNREMYSVFRYLPRILERPGHSYDVVYFVDLGSACLLLLIFGGLDPSTLFGA